MTKWWNWVLAIALFCVLFIAVPLSLSKKYTEADLKPMFDDYLKQFNKTYRNITEYSTRLQHFVTAVQEIDALNGASRGPEALRARYGLTPLSDMSKEEFRAIHLSDEKQQKAPHLFGKSWSNKDTPLKEIIFDDFNDIDGPSARHQRNRSMYGNEPHDNIYIIIRKRRSISSLPLKVDWREKGVVGLVRNQGLCGACWAFSALATMESMNAIKTGKLDMLSVQQVIDCAGLGNSGCAGGDICLLLDWLQLTDTPVELEQEYPLKLTDGACKIASKNATGVRLSTYTCDDFVNKEDKILEALATHGPVTVAVNAITWQNYIGGVIQYHCSGAAKDLNHAVQLVGYDLSAEVPYYIAKNSWGSDFGNAGYLMLAIGTNICGLANEVATMDVK